MIVFGTYSNSTNITTSSTFFIYHICQIAFDSRSSTRASGNDGGVGGVPIVAGPALRRRAGKVVQLNSKKVTGSGGSGGDSADATQFEYNDAHRKKKKKEKKN